MSLRPEENPCDVRTQKLEAVGPAVCGLRRGAREAKRRAVCRLASGSAVSPSLFFLVLCSQQLELSFCSRSGSLALFDIAEH